MHSDSDNSPMKRRKAKTSVLDSSSSSDDESDIPVRKRKFRQRVSSSSSDSDDSIIISHSHKKLRVLSENSGSSSSSHSSDSEVETVFRQVVGKKKPRILESDSDSSEGEKRKNKSDREELQSGSQSSDDESERCIICFKAFRGAVAHPSGCRHNFHSECLLTWSKTSNTCPIDRVKYTQVIVISPEGGIISRHEVSTPPPQDHNDIEPDDPTFCEVCHQHDREHEMLLCDRCEAGYHMNCLDPPLSEVPLGNWFCPHCSRNAVNEIIDDEELNELLQGGAILESRLRYRAPVATSRRVGPRTRAAQRVIASIREMAEQTERYQPSSSTSRSTSRRSHRRKKSHQRKSTHYKVELITVEDGSTIEVKVAVNTRVKRKKKRKSCGRGRKSFSKRTSSSAGGIDIRGHDNSITRPLDIMGSRPQLEYFSGCEAEDELEEDGGLSVLRARSSVATVRGMANRKQIAAQMMRTAPRRPTPRIAVSSAPPDLLSSILTEQTKWHSPNAVIHSNSNGEVRVVLPDKPSSAHVKKAAGNGEALGSGGGAKTSTPPSSESGTRSEQSGEAPSSSSSSVPPLQPPPQPVFSRVYEDEDFDLYADIEPPRLAPPPEPPALLLALEGDDAASSPEDTMLVIDDRQTYDPDVPTSPPPSPPPEEEGQEKNEAEKTLKPPGPVMNQGAIDLSNIRLPSPEPDIDDCPNRVSYSETSINIAKEKQDSDGEMEMPDPPGLINKSNLERAPETVTLPNNEKDTEVHNEHNVKDDDKKLVEGDECSEKVAASNSKITEDSLDLADTKPVSGSDMIYDPELSEDEGDTPKFEESAKVEVENKAKLNENADTFDKKIHLKEAPEEKLKVEDADEKIVEKVEDLKLEDETKENISLTKLNEDDVKKEESKEETETEEKMKLEEGEINAEEGEMNSEEGELKEDDDDDDKSNDGLKEKKMEVQNDCSRPSSPNEISVLEKCKDNNNEEDVSYMNDKNSTAMEKDVNNQEKINEHETSPESTPPRKIITEKVADQEGEDVLELGCGDDERDGLVDITDEEISTYEKSWELEDNHAPNEKSAGLEGLETEAISEGEDNMAEEGHVRTVAENGPKEEGEIISDEKRVPVAWKKVTKAKERSYREKESVKEKSKKKEKKPKEKRKELERYDVRKIISDKPKKRKVDEFGRDISPSRSRSLSDSRSRSKSRSRSVRSRKSRSRSRSKSRRRRSRERRSRNRSRVRSRGRSRIRSRDRSKRRVRSKSRSRSDSRRRKSKSPRKKERRSRAKSRDKKRRKRDSSISCSSCSCSSCERERRKSKKLTVTVPNEPVRKDKKKNKYKDRDLKRRRVDSPIPSKEVFTSGDNILVSVNFKSSKSGEIGRKEPSKKKKDEESKKKKDKSSKENQPLRSIVSKSSNQQSRRNRLNARNLKPVAIIDLAQSPFREQTLSPKEIIILTDSDSDEKRKPDENNLPSCQITGPKTPPEPHIKFNIVSSKPQMLRSLANPLLDSVDQLEGEGEEEEDERVEIPHKGPNTPPEPPVPYDPFEPTKSRSPTPIQELEESHNPPTPPGDKILPPEPTQRPASPPKPPPEPPKTPSPLHSPPPKPPEDNPPEKTHISPPNICDDDSMDMGGGDSPYSPGSSNGEDTFEPPVPQMTTPVPLPKTKARPGTKLLPKLTPSPLKRKPGPNKNSTPLKNNKVGKKDIGMKLDEDQLKILDDLPNSAVEMQFLKKLNRQERVVEEVKMVLKPHYAKKHVNKEEYKEILRKSVPKICHSRSGEINPLKIQRLIEAYVKKYRHLRKKRKMATTNFSGPESIPLLKPKPKATMWC